MLPIKIRKACPDDRGFIFSSWKESFSETAWAKIFNSKREYYSVMNCILDKISPSCTFSTACFEEDISVALGWLAKQPATSKNETESVVYIYVKPKFRRMGIAKTLWDGCAPLVRRPDRRAWFFDIVGSIDRAHTR